MWKKHLFTIKGMRKYLSIALLFTSGLLYGQHADKTEIKEIVQVVADRIIDETTFTFVNSENGDTYTDLSNEAANWDIEVESYINDWRYENGGAREIRLATISLPYRKR